MLRRYRALGADLPFGDPRAAHPGVAMEGYFWRFTDARSGRVVVGLCGVSRADDGRWANVSLAEHPSGFHREGYAPEAGASAERLDVHAGAMFHATEDRVRLNLDDDARLDVRLAGLHGFPTHRLPYGGAGLAHALPGLSQYWHPHILGGRATGTATIGDETIELDGAQVYAEKNWGRGGFPDHWWWGQAQGFDERPDDVCVAFAGGPVHVGPVKLFATALVVRLGDEVIRLGDPVRTPVRHELDDHRWQLRGKGLRYSVEVDGRAPLEDAHVLPVPLPRERRMVPGALEHLGGTLTLKIRRGGKVVYEGTSQLAGLEHGSLAKAQAEVERRAATSPVPR